MENLGRVTPATALVLETLLSSESVWGLQIVKDVGKKPGTVYPILYRLEPAGWVQGEWISSEDLKGPRRRYYRWLAEARPLAQEYVTAQQAKVRPSPVRPSQATLQGTIDLPQEIVAVNTRTGKVVDAFNRATNSTRIPDVNYAPAPAPSWPATSVIISTPPLARSSRTFLLTRGASHSTRRDGPSTPPPGKEA